MGWVKGDDFSAHRRVFGFPYFQQPTMPSFVVQKLNPWVREAECFAEMTWAVSLKMSIEHKGPLCKELFVQTVGKPKSLQGRGILDGPTEKRGVESASSPSVQHCDSRASSDPFGLRVMSSVSIQTQAMTSTPPESWIPYSRKLAVPRLRAADERVGA